MTSLAARISPLERLGSRPLSLPWTAAAVAVLVIGSAVLRTRGLDAGFWIDEGLSVGLASHSIDEIPGVLRQDGSPPLYYLLLHVWMQAFGNGEVATHVLSLVFSLLAVPAAFWAGRTLFGHRAGWAAGILAAVNPFLTFYAQETRMYSMVGLFGLLMVATFLHVFVDRDRRYIPGFVVSLAVLLYTHNWGFFLAAGTLAGLAVCWHWSADRRDLLRDGAIAYGAVALLYLPWLPTLVFQSTHTGAPWAERPSLDALLSAIGTLVGGPTPGVALLLVAGSGLLALARREAPAEPGEPVPVQRSHRIVVLIAMTVSAVVLAWVFSQLFPAWANRYFAVFVGPLVLLVAVGLTHAGRLGLVALVIVFAFWLDPRTTPLNGKSNARSVAASIQTLVTAGDVVVSTHPEQLPLLAYYLPEGVRYWTSMGSVEDPRVMDWRDALPRLEAARPRRQIDALVATMKPGQELVLVQPIIRTMSWDAPWTNLVRRRAAQWERRLDGMKAVRREAAVPVFGFDRLPRGVRAVVYRVQPR
jgi:hypothetical protein